MELDEDERRMLRIGSEDERFSNSALVVRGVGG